MLLHRCKCGVLIPQELRLCPDCEAKESDKMSRHMEYNLRPKENKKAAAFYVSAEWRKVRAFALSLYDDLDMYAYYVQTIKYRREAQHGTPHHGDRRRMDAAFECGKPIPVKQWKPRYHQCAVQEGRSNEKTDAGAVAEHYPAALGRGRGYRKSFDRAGLVAPPLFCGRKLPTEISDIRGSRSCVRFLDTIRKEKQRERRSI